SPCLIDDADTSTGDEYVGIDVEQVGGRPHHGSQVVHEAVAVAGAQIEELGNAETDRAPDAALNSRKRDEPGAALCHLNGGGAPDFAETFDGHGAPFEAAKDGLGRGRDAESREVRVERH